MSWYMHAVVYHDVVSLHFSLLLRQLLAFHLQTGHKRTYTDFTQQLTKQQQQPARILILLDEISSRYAFTTRRNAIIRRIIQFTDAGKRYEY